MLATQPNWRIVVISSYKFQWRFAFSRTFADHVFHLASLRGTDNGNSRLDDSRFFARYLSKRVSQPFFMIEVDCGNDCHVRLNGISRIEASTDSSLENDHVNARLEKAFQRQRRYDFEKRRMRIPTGDQITNRGQAVRNSSLGNHFAVDTNAFTEGDEVRGCEQT